MSETNNYGLHKGQLSCSEASVFSKCSRAVSLSGYSVHPPSQKSDRCGPEGTSGQRSRWIIAWSSDRFTWIQYPIVAIPLYWVVTRARSQGTISWMMWEQPVRKMMEREP